MIIHHMLDLIFSNEENMVINMQYMPGLANSDYVCLQFNLMCYTSNYTNTRYKYNLRRADTLLITQILVISTTFVVLISIL